MADPEMIEAQSTALARQVPDTMQGLIGAVALDPQASAEKLEKLYGIKEKDDAAKALYAYNRAMNQVQTEVQRVFKNKTNSQTNSRYADLESLDAVLRPVYSAHGFSLSFSEADGAPEGHIRVACRIAHVDGHSERAFSTVPIDDKGIKDTKNKTGAHAYGSTVSYARRYLTMLIFNVILTNDDNDAQQQSAPVRDTISATQCEKLLNDIAACGGNLAAMLKRFEIDDMRNLPMAWLPEAEKMVAAKVAKNQAEAKAAAQ